MTPRIPTAGQVCGTLALAAFFWWVNFGLHLSLIHISEPTRH